MQYNCRNILYSHHQHDYLSICTLKMAFTIVNCNTHTKNQNKKENYPLNKQITCLNLNLEFDEYVFFVAPMDNGKATK